MTRAEILEKTIDFDDAVQRIVSLEKENEELRIKYLQATDEGTSWAHLKSLEKEVAELKNQQFSLRNERNTFLAQNEQYEKDLIDISENLAKAKEIIKDLLLMAKVEHLEERYESVDEAEQFLSEAEK